MSDESLADGPTETVDVSPALEPTDFDFEAFLQGVRPTRRAVRVYARPDLVAQMEEVAGTFRDDLPAAQKKKVRDEVLALRAQFDASATWFVAEARSAERQERVRQESAKRHGFTIPGPDAEGEDALIPRADFDKLMRDLLVDSIVLPTGVTAEGLARFAEASPTEYPKLITAMQQANTMLAQNTQVVTRDFSPAPSAKNGTAGSKRR